MSLGAHEVRPKPFPAVNKVPILGTALLAALLYPGPLPLSAQQPPAATTPAAPAAPAPVPIGNLQLQNASLVEVIDQLARQLHINYILDPAVKGGITLNTYGNPAGLDARNLLE